MLAAIAAGPRENNLARTAGWTVGGNHDATQFSCPSRPAHRKRRTRNQDPKSAHFRITGLARCPEARLRRKIIGVKGALRLFCDQVAADGHIREQRTRAAPGRADDRLDAKELRAGTPAASCADKNGQRSKNVRRTARTAAMRTGV